MRKEYRVHGCKADVGFFKEGKAYSKIERANDSSSMFWGVYEVQEDSTEKWIADFLKRDDAEMFTLEKEKEEVK